MIRSLARRALERLGYTVTRNGTPPAPHPFEVNALEPRPSPPVPPELRETLRADHPRLRELRDRYRGHAAVASLWSDEYLAREVDLTRFRSDNAYIWQTRAFDLHPAAFALGTIYAREHDPLGLMSRLREDGLFGAVTWDIDGVAISRDLLDSVLELNFLHEQVGLTGRPVTILDVGAGYGRLAHRASEGLTNVEVLCTDGVPLSTFLSECYLRFRRAERATVVPLDKVEETLGARRVDIAVSIHSFTEMPIRTIAWWLDRIASAGIRDLMILPAQDGLTSTEASLQPLPFRHEIESRGYELVVERPKYDGSPVAEQYGAATGTYFLFRR